MSVRDFLAFPEQAYDTEKKEENRIRYSLCFMPTECQMGRQAEALFEYAF